MHDEILHKLLKKLVKGFLPDQLKNFTRTGIRIGRINKFYKSLNNKGYIKAYNLGNINTQLGYIYISPPSKVAEKIGVTHCVLKRKIAEYGAIKADKKSSNLNTKTVHTVRSWRAAG